MISLNLIPLQLRKKGRGLSAASINIPQEVILGVGGGLVLLLLAVHLLLGAVWLTRAAHEVVYKAAWQKVLPTKKVLDGLEQQSNNLNKKIKAIVQMTSQNTIVWSRVFNILSDDLPKGLWLRKISLDKGGLVMEGTAVSKHQDEMAGVGNFVANLKKDDAFMADFSSLEVDSIQRSKRNTVEVADFVLVAKLK